jgi:DNA-binding transcriptional ArsR family regulator
MTTAHYERDDDYLWRVLKALGNPVRLQIVRFIRRHPRCVCNEIIFQLPDNCSRAQSTVSQHLKILRDANVIEAEWDGSTTCYLVNEERLGWINERLKDLIDASPR